MEAASFPLDRFHFRRRQPRAAASRRRFLLNTQSLGPIIVSSHTDARDLPHVFQASTADGLTSD